MVNLSSKSARKSHTRELGISMVINLKNEQIINATGQKGETHD